MILIFIRCNPLKLKDLKGSCCIDNLKTVVFLRHDELNINFNRSLLVPILNIYNNFSYININNRNYASNLT